MYETDTRRKKIENRLTKLIKVADAYEYIKDDDSHELHELISETEELLDRLNKINSGEVPAVVGVVGAFSSGKSSFINRLLREKYCPVDACPTTSSITHFKYGATKKIVMTRTSPEGEETKETISHDRYVKLVKHKNPAKKEKASPISFEYYSPIKIFRLINLIDTPGFENAANPYDQKITKDKMRESDVLFYVIDIEQGEVTRSGLETIEEIRSRTLDVLFYLVLNKADKKKPTSREKILNRAKNKYSKQFRRCFLFCSKPDMELPGTTSAREMNKILQEITKDKASIMSGQQSYLESLNQLRVDERVRGMKRIFEDDVVGFVKKGDEYRSLGERVKQWSTDQREKIDNIVFEVLGEVIQNCFYAKEIENTGIFWNCFYAKEIENTGIFWNDAKVVIKRNIKSSFKKILKEKMEEKNYVAPHNLLKHLPNNKQKSVRDYCKNAIKKSLIKSVEDGVRSIRENKDSLFQEDYFSINNAVKAIIVLKKRIDSTARLRVIGNLFLEMGEDEDKNVIEKMLEAISKPLKASVRIISSKLTKELRELEEISKTKSKTAKNMLVMLDKKDKNINASSRKEKTVTKRKATPKNKSTRKKKR